MSKRIFLSRYIIIINKLKKAPASFKEITDVLEKETDLQGDVFTISKRTFQRDLDEIRSLYNIDIVYNYSERAYCIVDEPQSDANIRMLEAFDLFQAMKLSENVSQHICFEKRQSQGTQYLLNLLQAVKNQQVIEIIYQKFWTDKPSKKILQPLAIKESRGRWYLVANVEGENHLRTFGLDRIHDLILRKQGFNSPPFDVNAYYHDCFGIIRPEVGEPEEIILSFTPLQGQYVKTYPLHHSQKLLIENKMETHFSLFLHITFDFIQELLSHGNTLKVISSQSLIEEMKEMAWI